VLFVRNVQSRRSLCAENWLRRLGTGAPAIYKNPTEECTAKRSGYVQHGAGDLLTPAMAILRLRAFPSTQGADMAEAFIKTA